jgi:hypothetical protein
MSASTRFQRRVEPVEDLVPDPLRADPEQAAQPWQRDLLDHSTVQIGQLQSGGRPLEIAECQTALGDGRALEDGVLAGGDDLLPFAPARLARIDPIEPVGGGVQISSDKQPAVRQLPLKRGRESFGDGDHRPTAGEILEIEIGLVEGAGDTDEQPVSIRREAYPRPILLLRRREDYGVGLRIVSKAMKKNPPMVVLLSLGDITGSGIAGVIEAAPVRQPGQ